MLLINHWSSLHLFFAIFIHRSQVSGGAGQSIDMTGILWEWKSEQHMRPVPQWLRFMTQNHAYSLINNASSQLACQHPASWVNKHTEARRQVVLWTSQLHVLRLGSAVVLLKMLNTHLISNLRGLYKVLSFKDRPPVKKHFLHLCSAHQLSGVWRGAAALWIYCQIWNYVCGCFPPSDSVEWSSVWGGCRLKQQIVYFMYKWMFCRLPSLQLQSVWILQKETFVSLKIFKLYYWALNRADDQLTHPSPSLCRLCGSIMASRYLL